MPLNKTTFLTSAAICLILSALAYAGVPQTINYQGYLTTTGGVPATGPVSMVFSLYSSNPARNNPVWRETQPTVPLSNGIYSTKLGSVTPINASFNVPHFLGIKVGSDAEMPLQPLASVPYAIKAGVAESVISSGNATIQAGGQNVIRIEPGISGPNIAMGDPGNTAGGSGIFGATVSGGGITAVYCFNPVTGLYNRSCTNTASNNYTTVSGGFSNTASGRVATVGGGAINVASGDYATVSGGTANTASGLSSTVSGGGYYATNCYNPVSGLFDRPCSNNATGDYATVGGGESNIASDWKSTVSGGESNSATINWATVSGGFANLASASTATVAGGARNKASGNNSFVAGGTDNTASGQWSFAGGRRAKTETAAATPATHDGAFVFADANDFDFRSTTPNEFAVRATGGARIVTAIDGAGNATKAFQILPNGNVSINGSLTATGGLAANTVTTTAISNGSVTSPKIAVPLDFSYNIAAVPTITATTEAYAGIKGVATSNANQGIGVWGESASYYGVWGTSASANGNGVYGSNSILNTNGYIGGYHGVAGFNAAGGQSGVYGQSSHSVGYGVLGNNTNTGAQGLLGAGTTGVVGYPGAAAGSYAGFFYGNVNATGNVTAANFPSPSDLRLKSDIQPLESALDKVLRLRGVSYVMNADETKTRKIGVIAQELELEYPELVLTDSQGMKSVIYANLTAVLIEAVKGLKTENDTLKSELAEIRMLLKANRP